MELRKSQPQKGTPARRRAKRPVNSPARKTYASENDMPSEASLPIELPGPFTPRKSASNSPAPSSQTAHPKPKPRNGNNTRVKQASSPRPPKHGQTTPPQTAAVPKAIPVSAFAGATFHASPAPSSLPIPSFLSKGPGSPSARKDIDRICGEPSPPATDSEAPTPQHRLLKAEPTLQESPLDIFFRADRAEKERARRASSANILRPHPVPFSPPAQIRSPQEPKTVPRELFSSGNRRHGLQRKSSTGIPVSELDGTPGTAVGPAFSKPYQDRIRAARSTEKRGEPMKKPESYDQNPATVDASERLKRLLAIRSVSNGQQPLQVAAVSRGLADLSPPFGTGSQPASASSASHVSGPESPEYSRSFVCPPPPEARYNYTETPPSSGISQAGNRSVITEPVVSRAPEIVHMEDNLRRLLKLNIGSNPALPTSYQSS
ncbi:uncharacterized protein B0T15DRAFT_403032 [Chaetomium strumarium]|uniref:Proteophosphoglycan 5 n=1 Tax=Chaetomium strumarium TaxID=1170767 RepID=A0AAJ0GLD6_9PEZI|nr:hypothetical protein B0T15DRAFT_403032 [Chaetomium strumarium]